MKTNLGSGRMSAFVHRDRIQNCYKETINDPFDELTNEMLHNTAVSNSVPMEFLIPPFLTGIAHFLNKSEIRPWGSWTQPSIIYSATVGFTGTNKTAAMDAVRNAIAEVESATEICDMRSRMNQSATVESLLKQLNNDSRQIQLWDELKTWQSSLGLYKTGSASDYDTTIYLTTYNGGTLKRQTCSSNISIQKPVVNICGMAHPGEICRCLDEERKNANSNDGLYSRFLLCMPKPEFRDADLNEEILPNTPSLARVFYVVDQTHKNKRFYMYDNDAQKLAVKFYNEQQEFLRENHSTDTYISGMLGKLKGHTQRLAMIIQAVLNAAEFLVSVGESSNQPITSEFQDIVKNGLLLPTDVDNICLINTQSTEKSINLAKYFMNHKKYLSGYTAAGVLEQSCNIIPQLTRKILLYPGPSVPCNAITRSTRNTAEQVKDEMKSLCEQGLGETKHEKPQGGGRLIFTFIKKNHPRLVS
ncbi:uncharacterized protein LOC134263323 [Saccostrea cucullata]|uniref:uncharacterized protein LOC134263323 n=1 Tax=Saccostrea cuccullata TaxID=36930 RepID=UPI002ED4107B